MARKCKKGSQSNRSQKTLRRTLKKLKSKRNSLRQCNRKHSQTAVNWFLGDKPIFSNLSFHGNIKWQANDLVRMALLFCWSEKPFVTDCFCETVKRCTSLGFSVALTTYQGFMLALTNNLEQIMPLLILQLQCRMREVGGEFYRVAGFVPIGFDGSRNSAPRTESNENELCCRTSGRGSKSKGSRKKGKSERKASASLPPQAWITLMWHMGLRLPWNWRLGPSDSSERAHVQEMIADSEFPKNTLFCGDAGFVGFDFWNSICAKGCDLLVRVGSNVKLIGQNSNWKANHDGLVTCWPKDKQNKFAPLTLRLVCVKEGKTEIYLLTSVLDPERLSKSALLELYKSRWGIEVEFRGLKQTLNGQKLRCRNVDRLYTELSWSILSMAIAELLAVREQIANKKSYNLANRTVPAYTPKKRSLAQTMRAIYDCLDALNDTPKSGNDLWSRLASAVTDNYQRRSSKKARYCPNNKDAKKLKPPKVRKPTTDEKKRITMHGKTIAA